MPSLWKKQKGNRISRLVADLQTPPKRGGSLVVETGFPTSIVDLFVKNRDKLKKPSKKHKNRSTTRKAEDHDYPFPVFPTVSHPHVALSNSQVPTSSIDDNNREFVAHVDNSNFLVEEIVDDVELYNDCCKYGKDGVFGIKIVFWLCILMGMLVLGVALYNKRYVWEITLGYLLLVLLGYFRNSVFRVLNYCKNAVKLSILKRALIVGVALYTERFVVGTTMGFLLLFASEYVAKSVFRILKPCEDAKESNRGSEGKGVLIKAVCVDSKKEVPKEGGNGVVSKREIEQEVGNGAVLTRGTKFDMRAVEIDEYGSASKGEIEQGNRRSSVANSDSCLVEEEMQNKPTCEIEALEQNYSIWPRQSDVDGYDELSGKKGARGKRENGGECYQIVYHSDKVKKKRRKFWKKFVAKHMQKKKKHKHKREYHQARTDCTQDSSATELEEEDELDDDELELADVEESSTTSSDEEDEGGMEHFGAANSSYNAMFQIDNRTTKSYGNVKEGGGNLKYLIIMVIPIAGLIRGRIFAIALTVICCVVFKMVRG